jgi:SH3-like domain-containing protein
MVEGEVCDWKCLGVFGWLREKCVTGIVWMVEGQVCHLKCLGAFGWLKEKCVTETAWQ